MGGDKLVQGALVLCTNMFVYGVFRGVELIVNWKNLFGVKMLFAIIANIVVLFWVVLVSLF